MMRLLSIVIGILWAVQAILPAHAASSYDASARVFRLDGGGVTYAFVIASDGKVRALYWGAQLAADDALRAPANQEALSSHDMSWTLTAQEYPGQGGGLLSEAALKVAFPDGNRDLVLRYAAHRLIKDGVIVTLRDIDRPVEVELRYALDPASGILARSAVIRNVGATAFRIDQAMAASLTLPVSDGYRLRYLTGRWASEFNLNERPIDEAPTTLESRRGASGHVVNPWFAIGRAGDTAEETGPVWYGALAWSGSWRITVERDQLGEVRVTGGFNPYDFGYKLMPGASLATPVFHAGFSAGGWGDASRRLHRYERAIILPQRPMPRLRPVIYNSWEATLFAIDEAGQMALAEKAAKIGVERFVIDDGWFGKRNDDHAGLGDWTPNPAKFPHGMKPLIDRVHALGMDFGLWVEPEMVNPDSDLYRSHPDWVINFAGRPRSEARNQLVLNLARPDVRDHVLAVLDKLVSENDIAFLKWDHNRVWSEPGWPERAPDEQQALYVDYVRNLYWIIDELRRRHPQLEIETCAGGGGRIDLGIFARTDEAWTSDNTDPFDRLSIQDGFTQAYAPQLMMAWVTDSPNWANGRVTSLDYRFLSAMQGGLGIGANLDKWDAQDVATATRMIAAYKGVRDLVQQGDLYRLLPPRDNARRSATLSVAPDRARAVMFAFGTASTRRDPQPPIRLAGLDPARSYSAQVLGGAPLPTGVPAKASGAYWMNHGVDAPLIGDFKAIGIRLDARP